MNCERVKELVLTDYTDGELDGSVRGEVEEHLAGCRACREFQRETSDRAVRPFKAAREEDVPSYIWERVKSKVTSQAELKRGALEGVLETVGRALAGLGRIPRSALAFAAAAAVLIAVIAARPIIQTRAANAYIDEQVEFLTKLETAELNGTEFFDTEIRTGTENIM